MIDSPIAAPPDETPGLGHNEPPATVELETPAIDPDLGKRTAEILEVGTKWANERPVIESEAQAEAATTFIKQCTAHLKTMDTARLTMTSPYRNAATRLNERFAALTAPVAAAKGAVAPKLTRWLNVRERERRAAEVAAQQEVHRAELEAQEAALKAGQATADKIQASLAAQEAEAKAKSAAADAKKFATPTRTKAPSRATGFTKTVWDFTITHRALIDWSVLGAYLNDDAIAKAIRAAIKDGVRECNGVRIFERTTSQVR